MEEYGQILEAIYGALREVNELDPDQAPLEQSPDTPLLGQDATLSSLSIVTLATVTEEGIDQTLRKTISVIDIFMAVIEPSFTVADLANQIAKRIGCAVPT